jgi:hypothetical protein
MLFGSDILCLKELKLIDDNMIPELETKAEMRSVIS